MIKGPGAQSVYGIPYQFQAPRPAAIKSANPRATTVAKHAEDTKRRYDLKAEHPGTFDDKECVLLYALFNLVRIFSSAGFDV